jgi:hypothetical protein
LPHRTSAGRGDGNRRRQRGLSRSAFLRKQCNGAHFDSHYNRHTVTLSQNADCEKLYAKNAGGKAGAVPPCVRAVSFADANGGSPVGADRELPHHTAGTISARCKSAAETSGGPHCTVR